MAFTAVFDADVLHPASQRDLLVRLAQARLSSILDQYGIEALTADQFLVHLVGLHLARGPQERCERHRRTDAKSPEAG